MPDVLAPPEPPMSTYTGGTAVQRATVGNESWEFDNRTGDWINLETGEALNPKQFSIKAGRTGNAAMDTVAAARAIRAPAAAPVAPPPMPVMAPQGGITPPEGPLPAPAPRRFITPEEMGMVAEQKPIPSTVVPPAPEKVSAYQQAMVRFLTQMKWKPADAMRAVGIQTPAASKPMHVGNSLVTPEGKVIYTAPTPPISLAQQSLMDHRKALEDAAKARAVVAAAKDPLLTAKMTDLRKQIDTYTKDLLKTPARDEKGNLINESDQRENVLYLKQQELKELEDRYEKAKAGGAMDPVAAPAPVAQPIAAPVAAAPAGELPKVTTQAQFDALPSGAIYIGTDGKKKRKP